MRYIGSKNNLKDFIKETIFSKVKFNKNHLICDLFGGTGSVTKMFRDIGYENIISNDFQTYSFILLNSILLSKTEIEIKDNEKKNDINKLINYFNELKPIKGYITNNYSPESLNNGGIERKFFTVENAMRIDSCVNNAFELREKKQINDQCFYYIMASIINGADRVANTTSVYGAFLKNFNNQSLKQFKIKEFEINEKKINYKVHNEDANKLITKITGDILYLDPPYNNRQYASNYHVLEAIATNSKEVVKGITGLPDWSNKKSNYSSKNFVKQAFSDLIKNAKFENIFISYNDEGLLDSETLIEIIENNYINVGVESLEYKRFKADSRTYKKGSVNELIFYGTNRK